MKAHHALPALLLAAVALVPAPAHAASPLPEGGEIARALSLSRAALGGAALEHTGIIQTEGTIRSAGLSGTQQTWSEIGTLRFAEVTHAPPVVAEDGFDGKQVWNRDGSGLVWVDGGERGRAQEIGQAFAANDALWSPNHGGATVVWGGNRSAAGHAYDVLVITPPGAAAPFELWFDKTTHLPERYVQTIGPNTTVTTYSNYRPVDGVMIPFGSHTDPGDGNISDITVTRAVANVPEADAHLGKPVSNVHDFAIANGATQTSVPIQVVDNHVYLSVMLNGKGPYRFIFDTGGVNLVDPDVAKEIGANGAGSAQGSGVGSGTESISFAKVSSLQVGDATVKDQLFFIAPTRQGFGVTAGQPVDGLIGFEVLSRFLTTFDYGALKLTLQMPGAQPPAGADVVPFVFDGQQPQFACSVDSVASQCTLDTGSRTSLTLMGPFMADHPQVVPANVSAIGVNGYGFGGASMGRMGRVLALGIGSYSILNVVTDFTSQSQGAFAVPFVAGNVGGGVWKRFALTLDYGAQTMALVPNDYFKAPDSFDRGGLFIVNHGGTYVVIDSRTGTPAQQAGIAKGDTIESIDGKPASSMSLQDLRAYFFEPPGTALQVGLVAKDGTKRTVTVTLRDFV
jgi:Aspartyl protease/PDZ domain